MSSDKNPESTLEKVSETVQIPASKPQSSRKNQGKVPKRIHKAEREKMKREHLNDLFLSLANVLEVSEETNGKDSVLSDATRFVKDMLVDIDSLRRESAALLSESQYVTMEKEELQDENSSLESQIAELQNQLKERVGYSEFDLNATPPECQHHVLTPDYVADRIRFPVLESSGNTEFASGPVTTVSKPQPRYPTPSDTWPSQLLERHPKLG
ncbi:hypothetical protein ACH5RR_025925 [Cinchona calisaya]|uniref:BHLH domain-containing protein n=1 Tax=Cinchona calisaya TaxID=153742 RepID=A0ABD2Z116_9GENT